MPQLGETVTEGTITRWLKSVGDHVDADEPLFEVSTDKVDSEVPAPAGGGVAARGVAPRATPSSTPPLAGGTAPGAWLQRPPPRPRPRRRQQLRRPPPGPRPCHRRARSRTRPPRSHAKLPRRRRPP